MTKGDWGRSRLDYEDGQEGEEDGAPSLRGEERRIRRHVIEVSSEIQFVYHAVGLCCSPDANSDR